MDAAQKEFLLEMSSASNPPMSDIISSVRILSSGLVEYMEQLSMLTARFDALHKTVYQDLEAQKQKKEKAIDGVDGMVEAFKGRLDALEESLQKLSAKVDGFLFEEPGDRQ